MPRPVSCAWCNAKNRAHEPSCPVGRELARLAELNQAMERHPSMSKRSHFTVVPTAVEARQHAPDCDCSWWCRYFSEHADDQPGAIV
jgi:hypothetical protein